MSSEKMARVFAVFGGQSLIEHETEYVSSTVRGFAEFRTRCVLVTIHSVAEAGSARSSRPRTGQTTIVAEGVAMWHEVNSARLIHSQQRDIRTANGQPQATGLDSIAVIARRNRCEEIQAWDGAGEYWYRVISGAAKFYVVLPGGRRQILDLLLPNDFFGSSPHLDHYCTLEAVVNDTVVACYPRKSAEALAENDPEIGRQVREMASDAVSRMQDLLLIIGRTTAREKVGSFLLKMTERTSDQPTDRLMLLTSRYDIADYLALSVETVSRSLTDLRRRGLITLAGPRRVRIIDRHGLEESDKASDLAATGPSVNGRDHGTSAGEL